VGDVGGCWGTLDPGLGLVVDCPVDRYESLLDVRFVQGEHHRQDAQGLDVSVGAEQFLRFVH